MVFCRRIRDLREAANLTQEKLAKQLEIRRKTYIRYEMGIRSPPITFLAQLAVFYNLSSDYLLGLTNTPIPLKSKKH